MSRQTKNALYIFFLVILGGIFLYSCNLFDAGVKQIKPAVATQPAALMAEISTSTPEPTATETAIPLPTLDDRYIKQQQELADIARQEADAANIKANAHSTEVENAKIIAGITATQVIATATAQAQREATLQAVQTQKAIIAPTEAQATQRAVMFIQAVEQQKQADNKETVTAIIWQVVAGASVFVFVVVIAFLGLQIVNRKFPETFSQPVTENEAEEPEPQQVDTMLPPTQVTNFEGNEVFEKNTPITSEEYFTLRTAAQELKGVFSRRRLSGEYGKKYFTDTRARQICTVLQTYDANDNRYGQPWKNETTLLTEYGWKWLRLNPIAPPSDEDAPKNAENTVKTYPTPPQNTEGDVTGQGTSKE